MDKAYKPGDVVVYGSDGLCTVTQLKNMCFSKNEVRQDYYVLVPLEKESSTYYIPVNSDKAISKLRYPLTKTQINEMLLSAGEKDFDWPENRQLRGDFFRSVLSKGVSAELVSLIHCIYIRKEALSQKGKNISSTDEGVFSSAEKMLERELSYSLGIEKEQVSEYINSFLSQNE